MNILLTDCSEENLSEFRNFAGDQNIKFEKCKYSYKALMNCIDSIVTNIDALNKQGVEIDELYEDVWKNKVIVSIRDLDAEKESSVRKLVNVEFIECKNSDGIVMEPSSDIEGGYAITSTDNYASSTIGFCATRYGVEGYVIAGHAGDFVGEKFKYNGVIIGEVTDTAYYDNSFADAAFLEANSNGNTTDNVVPGDVIGGRSTDLPVGTTIYMYGKKSGLESGTILSNYHIIKYDNIDIIDCVKASYDSEEGDSGGPVLLYEGSYGGESQYTVLGVHSGNATDGSYSTYSKYCNIEDELHISVITN